MRATSAPKGPELELILKKIAEERLIEPAQEGRRALHRAAGRLALDDLGGLLRSGDAFRKILDANKDKLKSPDEIYPGMQLVIPGGSDARP